ncbi:MAG: 4-hydroxyphenylpyruvate dioxygenase [Synechococcales bacterium]|nr:4-hydroxyphenylpyruvate dioxygenase [Synechococcales bacterium]
MNRTDAMDIEYVHFYVDDAPKWQHWFLKKMGFQPADGWGAIAPIVRPTLAHTFSEPGVTTRIVAARGVTVVLSSPASHTNQVAAYLNRHPPGVADLAFRVADLAASVQQALAAGAKLHQPIQRCDLNTGWLGWAQVSGWGDLRHTLVEWREDASGRAEPLPRLATTCECREKRVWRSPPVPSSTWVSGIDHVVVNVPVGELAAAVDWYERALGFQRQQTFDIRTERSALRSQVLVHAGGRVQLPINEPASARSQIQEFLDVNRGAGVQHIALQTPDILTAIAHLRQRGVQFLPVPASYYDQLQERPGFQLTESQQWAIAQQQVLVDWRSDQPDALLLQAFTQPIFGEPTCFFEIIQRQTYAADRTYRQAEGFGEGNFKALFQAIEREQMKRGSLT